MGRFLSFPTGYSEVVQCAMIKKWQRVVTSNAKQWSYLRTAPQSALINPLIVASGDSTQF
jgi:hypothetical protein